MTTAPRADSTIDMTLARLKLVGWDSVIVCAEPGTPMPKKMVQQRRLVWEVNAEKLGPAPNMMNALAMAGENDGRVLFVQDDVTFAVGLRGLLDAMWPHFSDASGGRFVASCYVSSMQQKMSPAPGASLAGCHWWNFLHHRPADALHGALCFAMPSRVAAEIASSGIRQGSLCNAERNVHLWCRRNSAKLWLPRVSLCEHIGVTSTVHHVGQGKDGPARKAGVWIWNAGPATEEAKAGKVILGDGVA